MIPLEVLRKWSNPGKNEMSKQTYSTLKNVLNSKFIDIDIRLQGSYANSTNVRDNSDIDILVICTGYNIDTFPIRNTYGLHGLRDSIFHKINGAQNFQFVKGGKTIQYEGSSHYVPADIIPCVRFKDSKGSMGIALYDHKHGKVIYNYPVQHQDNGEKKSGRTDGNYKKAVRMYKNARNTMIDRGIISENTVSSYFIECLLYNLPDSVFVGNEREIFSKSLDRLIIEQNNFHRYVCQNERVNLFGFDDTQWNIADAMKFTTRLYEFDTRW